MAGGGIKINNIKINGGADGATFIPSVSSDGILSWTNDKGYTNPVPVKIKGANGKDGDDGATGAKLVSQVLQGQDANGGNIYLQTFDDGTTATFTAPRGEKGEKGESSESIITFKHTDFTWTYLYTINDKGNKIYTPYFAISSKKAASDVNGGVYHEEQYVETEGVSNKVQFFVHEYNGDTWLKRTNITNGGMLIFDDATTDFCICWGLQTSIGIAITVKVLQDNFKVQSVTNDLILKDRIDKIEENENNLSLDVKNLTEKVETLVSIDAISDNLFNSNTIINGILGANGTITTTNTNYFTTDFIPVEVGNSYIVKETQTFDVGTNGTVLRVCGYDDSKAFVSLIYEETRKSIDLYKHPFEIPSNIAYIRVGFRITDINISILRTRSAVNKSIELFYSDNTSYTQGMCVSDTHAFISSSSSKGGNKNDYVIKKILLSDGSTVATSTDTFNHANGMTYNSKTNKVIVCALDGNAPADGTINDFDYSLFIANADTLSLENTINLKTTILAINSDCIGISGVAYNKHSDEYYVLTRAPIRFIVVLDSDFKLKRYFFMHKAINEGVRGDICCDSTLIYSPAWRSDLTAINSTSLINEIEVYVISTGKYIGTYTMNGLTHIESMDVNNGIFYSNFIDFVSGNGTKTYKTSGIFNIS